MVEGTHEAFEDESESHCKVNTKKLRNSMTLREIRIHPNCIKFVDFHNLHLHLYKVYLIFSVFYTCTSYIITNNNQSYNIIIVHVGTCMYIYSVYFISVIHMGSIKNSS